MSYSAIARMLNDEGVKPWRAAFWQPRVVARVAREGELI